MGRWDARLGLVLCGLGLLLAAANTPALADASGASTLPRPGVLSLRTGPVVTAQLANRLQPVPAEGFTAADRYVIQLSGPITAQQRAALQSAGVTLGDYLPKDAFIADLSKVAPAELARLDFVVWVGEYRPEWRLDPQTGGTPLHTPERIALAQSGQVAVTVYLFAGEPLEGALTTLSQIRGAEVVAVDAIGDQPLLNVVLPQASVPALASVSAVQYVEEYPEFTERNTTDRWIVQSNIVNVTPLYDNGIHGEGQVVGHIDGPPSVNHCSFYDPNNPIGPNHRKILAYNEPLSYEMHGTHTAGTAVGDAGVFDDTRGVAYLAKLVHNSIPSLTEAQVYARLNLHRTQGATVHTNSWGNDATTAYDGTCRAIDNFSWAYDDNLVCFAVTNSSSLKNPENAKNCLAVGASHDAPSQDQFCLGGTGPTSDGRRKPEVFAPGCSIYSSYGAAGCSTAPMSGTSMACPAIAGTAMLVREYFTAGYYPTGVATPADGFTPSGALIKAVLLNSAVDMTSIPGYPSNQEGWGRVLVHNALHFPGDAQLLDVHDVRNNSPGSLSGGQADVYNFTVDSSQPLRITLVWHDYPAAVNAASAPVNNLDLVVNAPTGDVYRGNVFSGGVSVPGGSPDALNNVEQVILPAPSTGAWMASVNATAVGAPGQGYALLVRGAVTPQPCPLVLQQPASQTVCTNGYVSFSVAGSGDPPLSYQWRRDGIDIAGANSASYFIAPVGTGDAAGYDCVVSNGCGSATSNAATLTVDTVPTIAVPPTTHTGYIGQPTTFTVSAAGSAALSYQWRKGGVNLTDGGTVSGATTATLTLNPVASTDVGSYDVVVTDECGSQPSAAAHLWLAGDLNCDGVVNFADINPFVLALGGQAAYQAQFPNCHWLNADCNSDGVVSFADINPFVALLAQ